MATSSIAALKQQAGTLKQAQSFPRILEAYKGQVEKGLPRHMSADRMMCVVSTAFRQNSGLTKGRRKSVFAGIINIFAAGILGNWGFESCLPCALQDCVHEYPLQGGRASRSLMLDRYRTRRKMRTVKVHRDGREICDLKTKAGFIEYRGRILAMRLRQNGICSLCPEFMAEGDCTFVHQDGQGFSGGRRDDRINIDGKPYNSAAHHECKYAHRERA